MRTLAFLAALALLALPSGAAAQSVWARALAPEAREARQLAAAGAVDALVSEVRLPLTLLFSLDGLDDGGPTPEQLRQRALLRLDAALARDPGHLPTLALAANLHERSGHQAQALTLADRALSLGQDFPEAADAHFTRALACLRLGRHADARDAWLGALAQPLSTHTRSVALGNLGDTYMVLGDVGRAVDAYRGAAESDPENDLAWLGLGVARDRAGLDAAEALARAVEVASATHSGATAHGQGQGLNPDALIDSLERPEVFFEPAHERHYHEALAWEAAAREHLPGGRADPDPQRAANYRGAAREAWTRYLREAPPGDPWRPRAEAHARSLGTAAPAGPGRPPFPPSPVPERWDPL